MAKIKITKEDREEFKKTNNGERKHIWMQIGIVIDFLSTLGISFLNIFSYLLPNSLMYYIILYILLVIVVIGGEFIGTYYGALEQFTLNKIAKKEINYFE